MPVGVDGLGVVCGPEPPEGGVRSFERIDSMLAAGAPGLALAICRDLIARDALSVPGFAEKCAEVYRRLGRVGLAEIALHTFR